MKERVGESVRGKRKVGGSNFTNLGIFRTCDNLLRPAAKPIQASQDLLQRPRFGKEAR